MSGSCHKSISGWLQDFRALRQMWHWNDPHTKSQVHKLHIPQMSIGVNTVQHESGCRNSSDEKTKRLCRCTQREQHIFNYLFFVFLETLKNKIKNNATYTIWSSVGVWGAATSRHIGGGVQGTPVETGHTVEEWPSILALSCRCASASPSSVALLAKASLQAAELARDHVWKKSLNQ